MRSLRVPTSILLILIGAAFVAAMNLTPEVSSDFWWLLKVGDLTLQTGHIPRTIAVAFPELSRLPYVAHEWLTSVVWSLLFHRFGYDGVEVSKALAAVALYGLLYRLARREGMQRHGAVLLAALALLGMNFRFQWRPEAVALLGLALECLLLQRHLATRSAAPLVGIAALTAVWANSHGSFALAVAVPALLALGVALETRRLSPALPLGLSAMGAAAATLLTPLGLTLHRHVWKLVCNGYSRFHIAEWAPTFVVGSGLLLYLYVAFALALILIPVVTRRTPLRLVPLVLALFALSLKSIRHIPFFYVGGAWFLAATLRDREILFPARLPSSARLRLAALTLAVGTALLFLRGNLMGLTPGFYRITILGERAKQYLDRRALSGNAFNSMQLGGELAFHYAPRLRIGIDSRFDAYGDAYVKEYLDALHSPAVRTRFFREHHVDFAILLSEDLWRMLDSSPAPLDAWYVLYTDPSVSILAREPVCSQGEACRRVRDVAHRLPAG